MTTETAFVNVTMKIHLQFQVMFQKFHFNIALGGALGGVNGQVMFVGMEIVSYEAIG